MPNPSQPITPTTGGIPSAPDYRDGIASASLESAALPDVNLPNVYDDWDVDKLAVMDQNKVPACVSFAWAIMMKLFWYSQTGEVVNFSPRFLDILSDEDWIPIDGGRVPRTVSKIAAKYGCCTTAMLPNDTDRLSIDAYRDKSVITEAMMAEAARYKIPGYVRVRDDSVEDMRRAMLTYGAISALM